MTQEAVQQFLTNMKLIYQHGVSHSKNRSKIHLMFAIHDCHYVVEQIARERAKDDRSIEVIEISDQMRELLPISHMENAIVEKPKTRIA
jgi:hypothetical protein